MEQLKKNVDSILVVSNDKVRAIHGNLALSDAFSQADDILTTAAKGIAEIITVAGSINVDFEDVKTVMKRASDPDLSPLVIIEIIYTNPSYIIGN